jgi:hypothetical protein
MSVWTYEAANLADTDNIASRPIYQTSDISEFLSFERSQKRIICGLTGTGKTLFLKLASYHYRRMSGFKCIPEKQLTDRLYSLDYDFSGEKAVIWASHERWKHVWRTVLAVIVLRGIGHELHQDVIEIFPDYLETSVGAHLSRALQTRAGGSRLFHELFPNRLDAAIQRISQPVALFIDNIDEAFARHAGYDLYYQSIRADRQAGTHSYDIWLSAQIGFILAVRELSARNSHVKIFGTVRSEALRDNPTQTAFNAYSILLDLRYTGSDLREIFVKKLNELRSVSPDLFRIQTDDDPIMGFLGTPKLTHPTVVDANGRPHQEDSFDYLRRHTRGRPRELDLVGHELQMIPAKLRTPEAIRNVLRGLSDRFYQFAKNEAVPFWEPMIDVVLQHMPSNFMPRATAENIVTKAFGTDANRAIWGALYKNGLCGAVIRTHSHKMTQRFANHDRAMELKEEDFRSASTWVLHPCVNIATLARRLRYKPNKHNVAGHGYSFIPAPKAMKNHVHVLVGAGRLGLGLVAPVMLGAPGTRLVVASRRSELWEPVLSSVAEGGAIELKVSFPKPSDVRPGEIFDTRIRVVTDDHPSWEQELRKTVQQSRCVMFLYSEQESLQKVLGLGDSIGVSVGAKALDAVASAIAQANLKTKIVIAYENDEQSVDRAGQVLMSSGITMVPTVVDRICVSREIDSKTVVIKAEEYGHIIALVQPKHIRALPPAFFNERQENIRFVSNESEFVYERVRKRRLVNSMHAAAAALVQVALKDSGTKPETANDLLLGLIANSMDIYTQLVGLKELMILSVIGTMDSDHLRGSDIQALISDLNTFADESLARIRNGADAPSRVLQITSEALARKYRTLFLDVPALVERAMRSEAVAAVLPMPKAVVQARLASLETAFNRLFSSAA